MDPTPSPDKMNEVRSLIAAGNKIGAIKVYREITGVGLKEAKDAVEAMASDPNAPIPAPLPSNASQKSGCYGLLALGLGIGIVAWWIA
jgi:hypothetical protein